MRFDWREVVSRAAMVVMAALSLAGAAGLYHFASVMEPYDDHMRRDGASSWALTGAFGLAGAGLWLLFSAVRPRWKDR